MAKQYDIFVNSLDELEEGKEMELIVRDTGIYETKRVRAMVSSSRENLPEGDSLCIRNLIGKLYQEPRFIKIVAELDLVARK